MKTKKKLFVLSILLCELYLSSTTANSLFSQITFAQDSDCQNTISNSIRRIENARSTVVKVEQKMVFLEIGDNLRIKVQKNSVTELVDVSNNKAENGAAS